MLTSESRTLLSAATLLYKSIASKCIRIATATAMPAVQTRTFSVNRCETRFIAASNHSSIRASTPLRLLTALSIDDCSRAAAAGVSPFFSSSSVTRARSSSLSGSFPSAVASAACHGSLLFAPAATSSRNMALSSFGRTALAHRQCPASAGIRFSTQSFALKGLCCENAESDKSGCVTTLATIASACASRPGSAVFSSVTSPARRCEPRRFSKELIICVRIVTNRLTPSSTTTIAMATSSCCSMAASSGAGRTGGAS